MLKPPPHPREAERLEVLRACGILDTPAEPEFDDLVTLAAHIAQMPMALISLIDRDRQWFKTRLGLDATETPRDIAFCAHAILDPQRPLVVEDARLDARFADNPIVAGEPRVISYAGVPLCIGAARLPIGTLCVIDHRPRTLAPEVLAHLRTLARHAEVLIDVGMRQRQLEDRYVKLHRSEAHIQAILATMDEGLIVQRADGSIESSNAAAQRILGLSAEQICGRSSLDPTWKAVHADGSNFPGEQHPAMLALRSGIAVRGVVMGVGLNDVERRWILINSQPLGGLPGGPAELTITTFSDITMMRTKEIELTHAKESAESATRAKAEFLATMSHEIRTPMNGVIGLTEVLLDSQPREDQREMLTSIQNSGRALMEILSDILDFSKIEAGRLDLEISDVDPLRVTRDVVTVLAPQASGKGLVLEIARAASTPGA